MQKRILAVLAVVLAVGSFGVLGYSKIRELERAQQLEVAGLPAGSVNEVHLADGAVTGAKIKDLTITADDLSEGCVTGAKILNETIADIDIAVGAVTSSEIRDLSITDADIANDAVTSAKILNATIRAIDLADDAVTSAKLADNIEVENIYVNRVEVLSGGVLIFPRGAIANDTILGEDLYPGTITSRELDEEISLENLHVARIEHLGTIDNLTMDNVVIENLYVTGNVEIPDILQSGIAPDNVDLTTISGSVTIEFPSPYTATPRVVVSFYLVENIEVLPATLHITAITTDNFTVGWRLTTASATTAYADIIWFATTE